MEPRVIVPPADEPISLAQARRFLRIDVPGYGGDIAQDQDIVSWVRAARQWIEKQIDKSIGLQTLMIAGESFDDLGGRPYGYGYGARRILLPRGPVLAIQSVDYLTADGFDFSVDPGDYRLTLMAPQSVFLRTGKAWPAAVCEPESVRIIYRAGYDFPLTMMLAEVYADGYADAYTGDIAAAAPQMSGDPELYADGYADNYTAGGISNEPLPADLVSAMRLIVGHLYRHRTASVEQAMQELPLGVLSLLWANRASVGV